MAKSTVTYGLESGADLTTKKFQLTFSGLSFTAHTPNGKVKVESRLVGRINVYNILGGDWRCAGAGACPMKRSRRAFAGSKVFRGDFSGSILGQPFLVVVDYAHTDDALENLIRTARELNPKGRIITLFGCGGGKDRTKRPVMGEVAGVLSDLTILSNDNPQDRRPAQNYQRYRCGPAKNARQISD